MAKQVPKKETINKRGEQGKGMGKGLGGVMGAPGRLPWRGGHYYIHLRPLWGSNSTTFAIVAPVVSRLASRAAGPEGKDSHTMY